MLLNALAACQTFTIYNPWRRLLQHRRQAPTTHTLTQTDHMWALQAYVSAHTGRKTLSYSLKLEKGKRDRLGEDAVASRMLLNALAAASGLTEGSHAEVGPVNGSEPVQVC